MKGLRWVAPPLILALGYLAYTAIAATEPQTKADVVSQAAPVVETQVISPMQHQVVLRAHGEVMPVEATQVAAQVSGEVVSWHPNFVAGGIVKRGEILFAIEPDNYEAAVLSAEADLASAKAALIEEQAQAAVAQRQAKTLPASQVTDLYLRKPQVLSAQARVKSAQAALKRAQRDLANCQVTAPYDALVVSREIGVGQYINIGTPVATLNNIESAEIHLPIPGFDSAFLPTQLAGIGATITRNSAQPVSRQGKVVRDLGVVEKRTRMMQVVVRLDDPYGINSDAIPLPFGSYVEVTFTGTTLSNVFKLPQELIQNRQVWVVNDNNELMPRTIRVVRTEGEFMFADQGLEPNDRLVVTLPEFPEKRMTVRLASQVAEANDE